MNYRLNAFILAAGYGERLRPITDHIPKPLLPILDKPVLHSILENVFELSINNIGINLHHKKELIENWIKVSGFSDKIILFPERKILGTGGALKNAESFLKEGIFLVYNSDILTNIDLKKLIDHHIESKYLVTLAVHDYPLFNNLIIDDKSNLKVVKKPNVDLPVKQSAFTGISVYSPEIFELMPEGSYSIVDMWMDAISKGYDINTFDVSGCCWNDIGTPQRYASTVIDSLKKEGETVYIHSSAKGCEYADINGYLVIGDNCLIEKAVTLANCILLPGTHIKEGQVYENCIVGSGFSVNVSEDEMFGLPEKDMAMLIGTGGSDRNYYRIRKDENSEVLMHCIKGDSEFNRHIEYTCFFMKHSIPVPELISYDSKMKSAMFEDLGDVSLYSWLKCHHDKDQVEGKYKEVIDILILFHIKATRYLSECPILGDRIFDYNHLRWETEYFIERYVKDIRNIKITNQKALNNEFHNLALIVDTFAKTIIHRDYQSQNIMLKKRDTIKIIDFQGARIGPPAYDIVSLLWDPYYWLDNIIREYLIEYYIDKMKQIIPNPSLSKVGKHGDTLEKCEIEEIIFDEKKFRDSLLPCRLQRHMQALGAYGFLSHVKGRKYFLKYIPEGLRLLKEDIYLSRKEYPELYNLIIEL